MNELNLPQQAFVNKFVAKTKFYERSNISSRLHKEFVDSIQRITWKYKLAEETIGISKTEKVTEIQIFELELKEQIIPERVLKVIDRAIPYQILYKFYYKNSFAWGITLKEGNKAENYYFSAWDVPVPFDFTGIDLEKVYQKLVMAFITVESETKKDFSELVAGDTRKKQLLTEIALLENKIRQEKQFNRKVEINKYLLEKKALLKEVTGD
ncbi:MAG: DUF4391 domain-containing protein [Chitinispirillaceae bacterium]|nr:DUF4391 domain-containing protein [Chitinispirillaceae bacterium]